MKPTEDLVQEHKAIKVVLGIMKNIADNIAEGKGVDVEDLEKIVDFLRTFADKCHHEKEEDALFPAMVSAGMSRHSGPIAVMFEDHMLGRKYISDIENALNNYRDDKSVKPIEIAMLNYVYLLKGHILKEESILFPMADRILSEMTQHHISKRFEIIENDVIEPGIHTNYIDLLEQLKVKYNQP
jgi:hemerythrin-like domain-containing protein